MLCLLLLFSVDDLPSVRSTGFEQNLSRTSGYRWFCTVLHSLTGLSEQMNGPFVTSDWLKITQITGPRTTHGVNLELYLYLWMCSPAANSSNNRRAGIIVRGAGPASILIKVSTDRRAELEPSSTLPQYFIRSENVCEDSQFPFLVLSIMLPRVLICGTITWADEDIHAIGNFLKGFQPGGKYEGTVAVFRDNNLTDKIGIFDQSLVDGFPSTIKWIAHNGAGYDQIDVPACKAKGIIVSNTPGAVDDASATTALYLLISTLRNYAISERSLRELKWKPNGLAKRSHDLTGHTLAILGLGGIGMRLAELAHAFPMRIIYYSRHKVTDAPEWCEYFENVEEMLAQADVLSVHVPLNPNTVGLVGEKWIRALKKGAIIINTARGKVIDEDAMIRALEDGHLASVGLDVFPNEPEVNPRLLEFPHVTLLPHMDGAATPRPIQRSADSENGDSTQALNSLSSTLSKLEMDFLALNSSQPHERNNLQQTSEEALNGKTRQLQAEVIQYKAAHEGEINEIKSRIREVYPNEVVQQLSPGIRDHIKAEVQALTKDELKTQFPKLMPVSLKQQLDDTNKQLRKTKNAYENSEARSFNSSIDIVDAVTRNEQLKLVLRPDGEKSSLWPADLNSLFAYDPENVKKLLRDYELPIDKAHDANINCFLGYIGVKQQVV
ncbi:2-hydroxyacid dehydrogenase [Lentinula edodes]|uniref:2-hydroxyacid dehydrogenase n=1 Tax=Lentinula edodes TaxID=5353 RepID=A0A1Q3ENQ0_LENED|nr:2-hydroxyacid dehydrogenase [Lentinula edodes]